MKSMILAFLAGMFVLTSYTKKAAPAPAAINPLHSVQVSDAAGLLIDGTCDVSHFVVNNGKIWAVCKLKGKIGALPIYEDCMIPITVGDCDGGIRLTGEALSSNQSSSATHDCECLIITFEPCVIGPAIGPALTLTQQVVPCGVQDFEGDALCCANRLIGTPGSSLYEICACMNRLL